MSKKNGDVVISRRKVLMGVGAAAGALATLGLPGSAVAGGKSQHWDKEADVICVGSGAAAGTAAVTAVALGASVIVLEKMPVTGGTTSKSAGVLWIPNHPLMRARGQQDNRDDCLQYMARYAYPEIYDTGGKTLGLPEGTFQLLEAFYDNGSKMIEWMEKVDALKFSEFRMYQANISPPDYGEHLAENKANNVRSLEATAGSTSGGGGFTGGQAMVHQIEQWLLKHKVPVLLEHSVVCLIKDGDRIVGVEVQNEGKMLRVRARKGVIFGSGGYAHNLDLVRLHQPGLYGSCAIPGATGDFVSIAEQAGAKMGTLGTAWRAQVILEQALQNRMLPECVYFAPGDSMIQVNKYGKRALNEKRNYNDRTRAHFVFDPVNAEYPNMFMLMVFDERTLNRYAGIFPLPGDKRESKWLIEGKNLEELTQNIKKRLGSLASKIGTYKLADSFAANLDASIERFNKFAEAGRDEDFDRGLYEYDRAYANFFSPVDKNTAYPANDKPNNTMYPIDRSSMLYAVILAPGALDTSGGPAINANGQVLSAKGVPIPGLYGAGNCIASPTGPAYMGGGGTIGPAMTFGYIAAHHAVGQKA